jgi:hypothetical protein
MRCNFDRPLIPHRINTQIQLNELRKLLAYILGQLRSNGAPLQRQFEYFVVNVQVAEDVAPADVVGLGRVAGAAALEADCVRVGF